MSETPYVDDPSLVRPILDELADYAATRVDRMLTAVDAGDSPSDTDDGRSNADSVSNATDSPSAQSNGDETPVATTATEADRDHRRLLDVGCGTGNYAVPFAERGWTVHGIDATRSFLQRARERARTAGVGGHTAFLQCDRRDLDAIRARYDVATCVTAFGYFDDATNRAVLSVVADRLAPGGTLLLDTVNKEQWLASGRVTTDSVHSVGPYT